MSCAGDAAVLPVTERIIETDLQLNGDLRGDHLPSSALGNLDTPSTGKQAGVEARGKAGTPEDLSQDPSRLNEATKPALEPIVQLVAGVQLPSAALGNQDAPSTETQAEVKAGTLEDSSQDSSSLIEETSPVLEPTVHLVKRSEGEDR